LIKSLAKYVLGLALLAYVIVHNWQSTENGPGLAEAVSRPINLAALAGAAIAVAISAPTTFVRWFVLVRAQELPFTLRNALRLGMIAYFFNAVLPSAIGGDIIKAVGLARKQSRRTVAVATVVFDRIVGLWGLIWLVAALGAVYTAAGSEILRGNAGLVAVVRTAWVTLAVSIAVWIMVGLLPDARARRFAERLQGVPKVGGALAEAWRATWMYRRKPGAVAAALGLSFISQGLYILCYHNAVRVFADSETAASLPTLLEHSLIVPIGMIVQATFPAPGGVGGGEFAFGKLYVLLNQPESLGVLGSLALRMITWVLGFFGYLAGSHIRPSPET